MPKTLLPLLDAILVVLRGKKSKEIRPSNPSLKPIEVLMLHQSTSFCWHFTTPEHEGLSIRRSRFTGEFDLCRRSQVGPMCWETKTLSSHQTLEAAVTAADADALVPA